MVIVIGECVDGEEEDLCKSGITWVSCEKGKTLPIKRNLKSSAI